LPSHSSLPMHPAWPNPPTKADHCRPEPGCWAFPVRELELAQPGASLPMPTSHQQATNKPRSLLVACWWLVVSYPTAPPPQRDTGCSCRLASARVARLLAKHHHVLLQLPRNPQPQVHAGFGVLDDQAADGTRREAWTSGDLQGFRQIHSRPHRVEGSVQLLAGQASVLTQRRITHHLGLVAARTWQKSARRSQQSVHADFVTISLTPLRGTSRASGRKPAGDSPCPRVPVIV
jgi:hypothetical protein